MSEFISFTFPQYHINPNKEETTNEQGEKVKIVEIDISLLQQILTKNRIKDICVYKNSIYISAESLDGRISNELENHNPTIELGSQTEARMIFNQLSKCLCNNTDGKDNIIIEYPSIKTIKYLLFNLNKENTEEDYIPSSDFINAKIYIPDYNMLSEKLSEFCKWRVSIMKIQLLTKDNKEYQYIF